MLTILVFLLCGVFFAQGRPGVAPVIIGGSDASNGEYPYILSIQYDSATTGWGHFCGATLYKSRYAITTAHCVENKQVDSMRVIAGNVNLNDETSPSQIAYINKYTTHPDYEVVTGLPNDIAIIELATPFTIGSFVGNAVLPPDDSNSFIQNNCYLAGWGQTDPADSALSPVLQEVQTPVISNSFCAEELSGFDNAAIFDTHICAQSAGLDSGACDADTGSPLTCCRSDTDCTVRYVAGVTSYVMTISGECSVREPSVHVRTSKFLAWIEANTP